MPHAERIAVLSSHPVALPALEFLHGSGRLVGVGVPYGETMHGLVQARPWAREYQAEHLRGLPAQNFETELQHWLDAVRADVVLVLCFPHKIPAAALAQPALGFLNFHTGLLPDYRGIDPIFWMIRYRETESAVTVQRMEDNLDAGPVLLEERFPVDARDTYAQHLQRMVVPMQNATAAVLQLLSQRDELRFNAQGEPRHPACRRPNEHDLTLHFPADNAVDLEALVRAANPVYGGAQTTYAGMHLRILEADVIDETPAERAPPGTILRAGADGLRVYTRDHRQLQCNVLWTEAGLYSGPRFAAVFGVTGGQPFGS